MNRPTVYLIANAARTLHASKRCPLAKPTDMACINDVSGPLTETTMSG